MLIAFYYPLEVKHCIGLKYIRCCKE